MLKRPLACVPSHTVPSADSAIEVTACFGSSLRSNAELGLAKKGERLESTKSPAALVCEFESSPVADGRGSNSAALYIRRPKARDEKRAAPFLRLPIAVMPNSIWWGPVSNSPPPYPQLHFTS